MSQAKQKIKKRKITKSTKGKKATTNKAISIYLGHRIHRNRISVAPVMLLMSAIRSWIWVNMEVLGFTTLPAKSKPTTT